MAAANDLLSDAYDDSWFADRPNSNNCSGFVKSAAESFGIFLPDKNADGIIAYLDNKNDEWEKIGTGSGAMTKATEFSYSGQFILVAATSKEYRQQDGHVAILLPKLGKNQAPLIYGGGDKGASSRGTKTIREVWNPHKHSVLRFYRHRAVLLGKYE